MNNNQNFEFLDIITIASFLLLILNQEAHKIDLLRDEVSKLLDSKVETKLNDIINRLDNIEKLLRGE